MSDDIFTKQCAAEYIALSRKVLTGAAARRALTEALSAGRFDGPETERMMRAEIEGWAARPSHVLEPVALLAPGAEGGRNSRAATSRPQASARAAFAFG